jgi:hypothetical protein
MLMRRLLMNQVLWKQIDGLKKLKDPKSYGLPVASAVLVWLTCQFLSTHEEHWIELKNDFK